MCLDIPADRLAEAGQGADSVGLTQYCGRGGLPSFGQRGFLYRPGRDRYEARSHAGAANLPLPSGLGLSGRRFVSGLEFRSGLIEA
jgi:hypothetical protein